MSKKKSQIANTSLQLLTNLPCETQLGPRQLWSGKKSVILTERSELAP
jgi:hypothetical protein